MDSSATVPSLCQVILLPSFAGAQTGKKFEVTVSPSLFVFKEFNYFIWALPAKDNWLPSNGCFFWKQNYLERNVKILASVVVFLFLLLLPSFVLQPEIYFNFIFLRENTNFHSGRFFFSPPLKTRFQLFRPIRSETSSPGSGKNRNQTNPGPNFRKTHNFFKNILRNTTRTKFVLRRTTTR